MEESLDIESQDEDFDLKKALAYCVMDIKKTCGILFPEIFYAPFSQLHQAIFDCINEVFNAIAKGKRKIAIAAPRGIGKTSIARAVVMRSILFRLQNFIVYLSNSAGSAEMQTENIKRDLSSNRQVRKLFGNIKDNIHAAEGIDESFSKLSWTAFGEVFILPRGAGQQVRGLNWANHRPQLVIIDDLENKDELKNEDNRKKLKEWFHSDLMKTEDRYSKGCIFIYIDTIKHEDSLLVDLLESPDWHSIQLAICDEKFKSLDKNYMTDQEILDEVAEARRLGTLDTFYMERMNQPSGGENAVFKAEQFKYFKDNGSTLVVGEEVIKANRLQHVTIVDPARTTNLSSADSAIITVAIDRQSRKIFVRDIFSEKVTPDKLYDEMFRQVKFWGSFILGYDHVGLSNFITQPIENECRVRTTFPMLIELPAKRSKEERVATLAPFYRLGYIYHNPDNCGKLELQLRGFPRSKLWDIMDALAYITYIMDKHSIFFDPGDPDGDEKDEPESDDDEYSSLKDEDMMSEDEMGFLI